MNDRVLRWLLPTVIVVTALVLSSLVPTLLGLDAIASFFIGTAIGYPAGCGAYLVWQHYTDKLTDW